MGSITPPLVTSSVGLHSYLGGANIPPLFKVVHAPLQSPSSWLDDLGVFFSGLTPPIIVITPLSKISVQNPAQPYCTGFCPGRFRHSLPSPFIRLSSAAREHKRKQLFIHERAVTLVNNSNIIIIIKPAIKYQSSSIIISAALRPPEEECANNY